jgi:hypothetical protein
VVSSFPHTVAWYENTASDCDGSGLPDSCEADCDADGRSDACDLILGLAVDCDGNDVPDTCDAACDDCDTDMDGCVDPLDGAPADPFVCGDGDADGCDDCSGGSIDPDADGIDGDQDGACAAGDCDDANAAAWFVPSPARLVLGERIGLAARLSWEPPASPGALAVRFDTLRAGSPSVFDRSATCVETDETDRSTSDPAFLRPGDVFFYLVRVENDCGDNTGTDSQGVPRTAVACP